MNKVFKLLSLLSLVILFSFTTTKDKKIIIIDAGHGGKDLGANRNGVSEKDVVLDIAKRIKALNKNQEVEIILTRDSDELLSLSDRSDLGNKIKPAMVLSLHVNNSTNADQSGNEIYTKTAHLDLAKKLASKFGDCKISERDLHLLRNSESPTMLLELGYISNEKDRNFLNSDEGKNEIATKILEFITA